MISAFSNEVRDLIYKLDSIPRKQDLLISSIGTDSLVKRIDTSITQAIYNKPSRMIKVHYGLFKGDFVPAIAFSTKKKLVYVLYYKDKTYLPSDTIFDNTSDSDIVLSTLIRNRWPVKIIDKNTGKSNVKDKTVYIITSEYARYLSEKDSYQYYPAFIQYIYTLLRDHILYSKKQYGMPHLFFGTLPNGRIYEERIIEDKYSHFSVRVYMYYYLAIVYHLYCKYANDIDDLPLQRFYSSIKEMKLYDSYEDFVEENKKLKEILN